MTTVKAIFSCAAMISNDLDDTPPARYALPEGTMFLANRTMSTVSLVRFGCASVLGGQAKDWQLAHDRRGVPVAYDLGGRSSSISIAAAHDVRALLTGTGPLGIDIETLDRVAVNAFADDEWLAPVERALLSELPPAERTLELGCRWVLREAYGKALDRGLDYPLARLAMTVRGGAITPVSIVIGAGWRFSLYRRDDLVIGIVAAAPTKWSR